MWIQTYHRFASRAAFLDVCDAAGWERDSAGALLPHGVALDIIGPLIGRPTTEGGALLPGEVIDARWHVNFAWYCQDVPEPFVASRIDPASPSRTFGITPPVPTPQPIPASIPAWKGKAWLLGAGLLDDAEAAAQLAGGVPLLAWQGAAEWHRDSDLMAALATGLDLDAAAIDAAFIAADAIRG